MSISRRETPAEQAVTTVLHLMGSLYPSGMERMLISAATPFAELGIGGVVVAQGEDHPYRAQMEAAGYEVHLIPPVRTLAGARALRRLVNRISPDVVHVHTESGYMFSTLATRLSRARPKIIRTIHNVFTPTGRTALTRRIQTAIGDRLASAVVVPSPDVLANERQYGRRPILIYNWVSEAFFAEPRARSNGQPLAAIIVGNCSPTKNHELALAALFEHGYTLYHHGTETHASEVELALLQRFADAGRLGHRGTEDPLNSLFAADVYAMPSLSEGMPVSLAEALAAGLPAVLNDAPGLAWARGLRAVTVVPSTQDAWLAALAPAEVLALSEREGEQHPDFRPARGAAEYAALYRASSARKKASE